MTSQTAVWLTPADRESVGGSVPSPLLVFWRREETVVGDIRGAGGLRWCSLLTVRLCSFYLEITLALSLFLVLPRVLFLPAYNPHTRTHTHTPPASPPFLFHICLSIFWSSSINCQVPVIIFTTWSIRKNIRTVVKNNVRFKYSSGRIRWVKFNEGNSIFLFWFPEEQIEKQSEWL